MSTISLGVQTRTEDVLAYLPTSSITPYSKGQTIYCPDHRPTNLYLVIEGTVSLSHVAEDGGEILLEVVRPEELFGEAAFLDPPHISETATAIETARVMSWTASAVEELVTERPRLALALLQILAQRTVEYSRRIESLAHDTIERRLARSLLHFSERLGTQEEGGSVWMMPFTHEMLSRYVGTSRELVSHYMGRFRSQGHVSYSRQGIRLHSDTLKSVLD